MRLTIILLEMFQKPLSLNRKLDIEYSKYPPQQDSDNHEIKEEST